jgi:hypothetical protein
LILTQNNINFTPNSQNKILLMKKVLLTLTLATVTFLASAQVIFSVQSPSSIAGTMAFTNNGDGSSWGLADLMNPADAITAELMLVDDGASGTNPQGNPVSAEGCGPLINDLTGKIAVIYRNTCGFGVKALNAQTAGAIGVIIVNRETALVNMNGGTEGMDVNIPVTFISDVDGLTLTTAMQSGPVVVFIGNKSGLFSNDIGFYKQNILVSKGSSLPALTTNNSDEYSFDLGAWVFNYGYTTQSDVEVTVNIDKDGSSVHSETSSPLTIPAGDSTYVSFSPYLPTAYTAGKYTLSYTSNMGATDEYDSDNMLTASFYVSDSIFGLAEINETTGLGVTSTGYRSSSATTTFSECIVYQDANASRLKVEGLYFSASTGATDSLSGLEMLASVIRINDEFTDLNDAPATLNWEELSNGFYYYPEGNQANLQNQMVYAPLNNVVALEDNVRYMFCVQTSSPTVYLGYNTKLNYELNIDTYNQPLVPVESDGTYNLVGFGADVVPSLTAKMSVNDLSIKTNSMLEGSVYPNPTQDNVTLELNAEGKAIIEVTDITGKLVKNLEVTLINGKTVVNLDGLKDGVYVFNVTLENETKAQFNVVKK